MGMKRANGFLVAFAIFAAYLPLSVGQKDGDRANKNNNNSNNIALLISTL